MEKLKICKHNNGCGFCDISKEYCSESPCQNEELVEYAPVKHGEWIKKIKGHTYYYACSNCGEKALQNEYHNDVFSDYCPHCGSMMDFE